jgi:hypothetical protein
VLLDSVLPLPPVLSRSALRQVATQLGTRLSERYWQRFRDAAIAAAMGRAHEHVQLAATRQVRERPSRYAAAEPPVLLRAPADVGAAVRRVYADAGRDVERAPVAIAPLDELIASYPIRVDEVPRLSYRRAAELLTRQTGRAIEVPADGDRALAGFLYCLLAEGTLYGCILVNRDDSVTRRRFSKAHELGHYVMHFLPLLERGLTGRGAGALVLWEGLIYDSDDEAALPAGHRGEVSGMETIASAWTTALGAEAEREANQFAAEVLLPEGACHAAVARAAGRFAGSALARRLAGDFLVSQQAMRRRLTELGLIERAVAGDTREEGGGGW